MPRLPPGELAWKFELHFLHIKLLLKETTCKETHADRFCQATPDSRSAGCGTISSGKMLASPWTGRTRATAV